MGDEIVQSVSQALTSLNPVVHRMATMDPGPEIRV